jgi:four helix bundle protein
LPKKDRFSLGQKIEYTMLDALQNLSVAYHSKSTIQKSDHLNMANAKLESLKIMIRLAKDVKAIDQKCYLDYQTKLQEIGKMLGGWMSSINKTSK